MSRPACRGSGEWETVRTRRVEGVAGFYASKHPSGTIPSHFHDRLQICLVVTGGYEERYPSESVRCQPGTVVALSPGVVHENRIRDSGTLCFQIVLEPSMEEPGARLRLDAAATVRPPTQTVLDLWDAFRHADPEDELSLEEGARSLLAEVAAEEPAVRLGDSSFPWLGRVLQRLRNDPRSTPTLQELADLAGVSRSHLAAAFKARFGCTVGAYLRQLRTRLAAAELTRTERPLAEIAYAVGFSDQPHMNRTFKRQVGITPGTFRERFLSF